MSHISIHLFSVRFALHTMASHGRRKDWHVLVVGSTSFAAFRHLAFLRAVGASLAVQPLSCGFLLEYEVLPESHQMLSSKSSEVESYM
jgi:hypothetical protein